MKNEYLIMFLGMAVMLLWTLSQSFFRKKTRKTKTLNPG